MALNLADWRSKFESSKLQSEAAEELRLTLLRDFGASGLSDAGHRAAVEEEVDRFLKAGRVSESNLSRLERRVTARLGGGSMSSRSEHAYSVAASELSASGRRVLEGPKSARLALPPVKEGGEAPEQELGNVSTWSQVAKYSQTLDEMDKSKRREVENLKKQKLRDALAQQVVEKKRNERIQKEEELRLFKQQEEELERWKQSQESKKDAVMKKVMQVKQLREEQISELVKSREEQQKQKLKEDNQILEAAAADLEREKALMLRRKADTKTAQAKLAADWQTGKLSRADMRQVRIAEEKLKVKEYHDHLDMQEARKKSVIPKVRPQPETAHPASKRRGEEIYFDDDIFQQRVQEQERKAREAEQAKIEKLKEQKHQTQEFLKQQVAERELQKRKDKDHVGTQRQVAQAASAEHQELEKKRVHDLRTKNMMYRDELQKQIDFKQNLVRVTEDEMSHAERAINKKLLKDAHHLHG